VVEVLDVRLVKEEFLQEDVEVLSLNETLGCLEPTVSVAQVEIDLEAWLSSCGGRRAGPGGFVLEGLVPGDAQDEVFQFGGGEAGGVESAHDGSHAGTGDAVDGDSLSSKTFRTPMWAMPRAPPPLRTRPMRGLPSGVSPSAQAGPTQRSIRMSKPRGTPGAGWYVQPVVPSAGLSGPLVGLLAWWRVIHKTGRFVKPDMGRRVGS
jgi:hypothetical protein